jgi:oligopeptide/dipeptide ABC transporter ATP-binding protein
VPSLHNPPQGCRYQNRCPLVSEVCRRQRPPAVSAGTDHTVACFAFGNEHAVAA